MRLIFVRFDGGFGHLALTMKAIGLDLVLAHRLQSLRRGQGLLSHELGFRQSIVFPLIDDLVTTFGELLDSFVRTRVFGYVVINRKNSLYLLCKRFEVFSLALSHFRQTVFPSFPQPAQDDDELLDFEVESEQKDG
jgi:hypothetical protein